MKLLHVIGSMDPQGGGPSEGIRSFAGQMMLSGNISEAVCMDDPAAPYLRKETIQIHAIGQGRGRWKYNPAFLPWLEKNAPRYDAVVLNGLWQYPGFALYRAASRPNMPPYLIFPHGMLDPWFQRTPERRLKAMRNWLYWKLIEQRVIRSAHALLFTCQEEMRLARETFHPYQPQREINVGFGVPEPPRYHASMDQSLLREYPEIKNKPYFLFLGRIHPKKGVDLLIKAYSSIAQSANAAGSASFPNLVIAGPGLDTPYGQNMQVLASKICPPGSVFWPGMLSGDAKWGALYNCEAFVLSSHQENFGVAIVEALACGKPVLISNQINIWREIEEDRAGLVDADTLEGTENLLRKWRELSPDNLVAMKRAARLSYENRFSIVHTVQNLMNVVADQIPPSRAIAHP